MSDYDAINNAENQYGNAGRSINYTIKYKFYAFFVYSFIVLLAAESSTENYYAGANNPYIKKIDPTLSQALLIMLCIIVSTSRDIFFYGGSIARRCGVEEPSSYLRQIFPFIRFSVFLVTLATGLVQFFRMQHLIKDEFHDDGDINFIFSTISAFIAATYSTGTEVLNTYYASKSDHYEVIEIDNETFQPLLTPAFRKEPQGKKMARSTIGFFSRLGASNSAFTESLALHNLMQKGNWPLAASCTIASSVTILMYLQNNAFAGDEFRQNFNKLFSCKPAENEMPTTGKSKHTILSRLITFVIGAITTGVNLNLTRYTIYNELLDSYGNDPDMMFQMLGIIGGTIYAIGELTEIASLHDGIKILLPKLFDSIAEFFDDCCAPSEENEFN